MRKARFNLSEISGAFGDLGTFVPIFVALVAVNGLDPASVLVMAGAMYVCSGLYYGIPMPVQPLKAMAAIAIAGGLGGSVIAAAGILIGGILLFLGVSSAARRLSAVFPRVIIRGIQFGVGLMLLRTAWKLMAASLGFAAPAKVFSPAVFSVPPAIVLLSGLLVFFLVFRRRFPSAISLLGVGTMVSIVDGQAQGLGLSFFPVRHYALSVPSLDDFVKAFFVLVIPQIPLTFANGVVAAKDTAQKYFGDRARRVTEVSLCTTMGITNVAAGLLGGMPFCHGSQGLTAHYSFGARTHGATLVIGFLFIMLGLTVSSEAGKIFALIPNAVLALMLFYVAFRHAALIMDLKERKDLFLAVAIGILGLLTNNLALSYGAGMLVWYLFWRKRSEPARQLS